MSRSARIEARISPELLSIVRRAAEAQGRSVSDFVVGAAAEAAQKVVAETDMIRLSLEASKQVARLLLDAPEPTPGLAKAFAARRRLIRN